MLFLEKDIMEAVKGEADSKQSAFFFHPEVTLYRAEKKCIM